MKKSMFLVPALLASLILPTVASAETVTVNNGKLINGTTFVPIRVISETLGSKVIWSQPTQDAIINDGTNETRFKINSREISINGMRSLMDVPVQLENGTTYVPLRVSSPTGAQVGWDDAKRQATVSLNDKKVVVNITSTKKIDTNTYLLPDKVKLDLIKKANETANLSAIKQIRTYFKPYMTDKAIDQLIKANGYKDSSAFKDMPHSSVSYSPDDENRAMIYQETYEPARREIHVLKVNGVWKIDSISIQRHIDDRP